MKAEEQDARTAGNDRALNAGIGSRTQYPYAYGGHPTTPSDAKRIGQH